MPRHQRRRGGGRADEGLRGGQAAARRRWRASCPGPMPGSTGDHGHRPIPASRAALKKAGWKVEELDLIEANEAFAAQACAVNKDLGWEPARSTSTAARSRSAIRSAPPARASWSRCSMRCGKRSSKKGLATLCIGGGMGIAMCVERRARIVRGGKGPRRRTRRVIGRARHPVNRSSGLTDTRDDDRSGQAARAVTMRLRLMARVALVTGGTRGIGAAISKALQGGRLQGRGELRRQRRGGAEVQGRDRHPGLQVGRSTSRPAPPASSRSRPSSGRSTCWSTTPASPATRRCTG